MMTSRAYLNPIQCRAHKRGERGEHQAPGNGSYLPLLSAGPRKPIFSVDNSAG